MEIAEGVASILAKRVCNDARIVGYPWLKMGAAVA
jgi:hypothetical protein